ncbi:hypothetical protein BN2476_250035 [Paraburkholderia piptadeniae]|uniref:Uncharacterized protein n=1 Tax=Paraburkholderia piptadeniae TaxID=1701573 RepID=A0A1N7S005_9BURK|nr:lactonase family protein [Paraburkholderia piptadeniae]SIT40708.1 hypothetical protein BN2476_250035 [Paraburkholderia piptadeniae]
MHLDGVTFDRIAAVDTGGKTPDGVNVDTKSGTILIANDDSNNEAILSRRRRTSLLQRSS